MLKSTKKLQASIIGIAIALPLCAMAATESSQTTAKVEHSVDHYTEVGAIKNLVLDNKDDDPSVLFCVYSNAQDNLYTIKFTSAMGGPNGFLMDSGLNEIAYKVYFQGQTGNDAFKEAKSGVAMDTPFASIKTPCENGGKEQAQLQVKLANPNEPIIAGSYTDTLTVLVNPKIS